MTAVEKNIAPEEVDVPQHFEATVETVHKEYEEPIPFVGLEEDESSKLNFKQIMALIVSFLALTSRSPQILTSASVTHCISQWISFHSAHAPRNSCFHKRRPRSGSKLHLDYNLVGRLAISVFTRH